MPHPIPGMEIGNVSDAVSRRTVHVSVYKVLFDLLFWVMAHIQSLGEREGKDGARKEEEIDE